MNVFEMASSTVSVLDAVKKLISDICATSVCNFSVLTSTIPTIQKSKYQTRWEQLMYFFLSFYYLLFIIDIHI